jgi:succinate dehydrogenase hydrophobic anchor subunit
LDPVIYFFAEYFPWWGIPSALILAELANHFRRSGQRVRMAATALISILLVILTVFYFTHDGFRNVRPAMKTFEREYVK